MYMWQLAKTLDLVSCARGAPWVARWTKKASSNEHFARTTWLVRAYWQRRKTA